jgi:hypothetical protein
VQDTSQEVMNAIHNGQPQQGGMTSRFKSQGNTIKSNWLSLKDLIINQAKINENMNRRLLANDKTLE